MTISEKVAYIQGLFDGLGLDTEKSGEARILSEMLDVLKEVGQRLDNVDEVLDEFDGELDSISDDVSMLEDAVYGGDEDDDWDGFDLDDEDVDEDFFEIPCPTCGEDLIVDDEVLEAGVVDCPACGGKFALSLEDEDDGDEPEDD